MKLRIEHRSAALKANTCPLGQQSSHLQKTNTHSSMSVGGSGDLGIWRLGGRGRRGGGGEGDNSFHVMIRPSILTMIDLYRPVQCQRYSQSTVHRHIAF